MTNLVYPSVLERMPQPLFIIACHFLSLPEKHWPLRHLSPRILSKLEPSCYDSSHIDLTTTGHSSPEDYCRYQLKYLPRARSISISDEVIWEWLYPEITESLLRAIQGQYLRSLMITELNPFVHGGPEDQRSMTQLILNALKDNPQSQLRSLTLDFIPITSLFDTDSHDDMVDVWPEICRSWDWSALQNCAQLQSIHLISSAPFAEKDSLSQLLESIPPSTLKLRLTSLTPADQNLVLESFKDSTFLPRLQELDLDDSESMYIGDPQPFDPFTSEPPIISRSVLTLNTHIKNPFLLLNFQCLQFLKMGISGDDVSRFGLLSQNSILPDLRVVVLHVNTNQSVDLMPVLLFILRSPIEKLVIVGKCGQGSINPLNDQIVEALGSARSIKHLECCLWSNEPKPLFSRDRIRDLIPQPWTQLTRILLGPAEITSTQLESVLAVSPSLTDLSINCDPNANISCLLMIGHHCPLVRRIKMVPRSQLPKITLIDLANSSKPYLSSPSFSNLIHLHTSFQLETDALHFLISNLGSAHRLAYFQITDPTYFTNLPDDEINFLVCLQRNLPNLRRLDPILAQRISKQLNYDGYIEPIPGLIIQNLEESWAGEVEVLSEDRILDDAISKHAHGDLRQFSMCQFKEGGRKVFFENVYRRLIKADQRRLTQWDAGNYNADVFDRSSIYAAVVQDGMDLRDASPELRNDKAIVLAAVVQNAQALQYASEELRNDKEIVVAAVRQNPSILQYASPELKKNKELVLDAVQRGGTALQFASPELQNDKHIVLAAIQQNPPVLQYASLELRSDRQIILEFVQQCGYALRYASLELKDDKEIVLAAVQHYGRALQHSSLELQSNKEIVYAAVAQNGQALQFASPELRSDKQIVLAAVRQDGYGLLYATKDLQNDKEIVLAAVQQNGRALGFASPELKNDKQIVLAAVQRDGHVLDLLQYYCPQFQNDKGIVLAAVQQNGSALQFASPELRSDKQIVYAALQQNTSALEYASEVLKNDPEFAVVTIVQDGPGLKKMKKSS